MGTAPPGAMCARHPTAAALEICERCGAFACVACTRERDGRTLCAACSSRTWFGQNAGFFAFASAVLGFLGLACGPLGAVAIVFGLVDLALIQAGRSPTGGRKLALWGIGLGAAGVLIGVAIAIRWFKNPAGFTTDLP